MKYGWIAFVVLSIGVVFTAYCLMKEVHRFSKKECRLCHVDIDRNASSLEPILSATCKGCHEDIKQNQSHPVDISPEAPIPADMPLVNGKLSCITCHFVHPSSIKQKKFNYFLLRRPGKGVVFCSVCHGIDEKGHILFENVHLGSYLVTNKNSSIDLYTLQCIECHDRYLNIPAGSVGAGAWKHFTTKFNHPVGSSYVEIATKKPRKFNPPGALPKEIRLFNGKIGCGTCHNVFSKEKFMLVMSNWQSRLCLECHNI